MLLSVILLIVFDQASKMIMNTFFQAIDIELIKNNLLGLSVYLNEDQLSVFNGPFLKFDLSLIFLSVLALFMSLFLISVYFFMKDQKLLLPEYQAILALYIAASISSTIDRVFWGGSLDFIVIAGWIVDFKDIYLFLGLGLLVYSAIKNIDFEHTWRDDLILAKSYFQFLGTNLTRIFNRE